MLCKNLFECLGMVEQGGHLITLIIVSTSAVVQSLVMFILYIVNHD